MRFLAGLSLPVFIVVGCATGAVDVPPLDEAGMPIDAGACTAKCDGGCADLKADPANCGKCGKACPMGAMCVQGTCQCVMGQSQCVNTCVDLKTDLGNCGKCGTLCGGDGGIMGGGMWGCVNGVCAITCPMGDGGNGTECGGACVNVQTDHENCGMCGNACAMTETCMQGLCCKMGETVCKGGADGGGPQCTNTQSDALNCGMCGKTCSGNTPACSNGTCIACGNDCWSNAGCVTGLGHCIRFACRSGSAGGTFCNACMGWQEVTYNDWINGGWCKDAHTMYYAQNQGKAACGGNITNCCTTKNGCGTGNIYWHFFDGSNNRYSGPDMSANPNGANCTQAAGTDNSAYTRLSVCKKN